MKSKLLFSSLTLIALIWVVACKPTDETSVFGLKPDLPAEMYDYSLHMPGTFFTGNGFDSTLVVIDPIIDPGFGNFNFGLSFNPLNPVISNPGATLGRVLFYDPQLSLNNRIACASCHKQEKAFSDDVAGSVGFAGKVTPRNSMAIVNAGFNRNLFWDSRSSSVGDLVTKPIQNHIEMGMEEMSRLENKLAKIDYYPALFQQAFGTTQITKENISSALAQFVCSITTVNSRFDQEQTNNFAGFSTLENMGKDLFFSARTNCNRCHAQPTFAAPDFPGGEYGSSGGGDFGGGSSSNDVKGTANNGLDIAYADQGLGNGKFRIPSLRNIALTAPYMHDGRFNTLEEVIDHYSDAIQPHHDLDKNLRNADGSPLRPNLNALEKKALKAFLLTLTDESLLTEAKYSNPFK